MQGASLKAGRTKRGTVGGTDEGDEASTGPAVTSIPQLRLDTVLADATHLRFLSSVQITPAEGVVRDPQRRFPEIRKRL